MTQDLKLIEEFIQKKINSIGVKIDIVSKKREELAKQIRENNSDAVALTNELREYVEILNQLKQIK
jgi:uncharacterized coiled-coil DUF342 family protein